VALRYSRGTNKFRANKPLAQLHDQTYYLLILSVCAGVGSAAVRTSDGMGAMLGLWVEQRLLQLLVPQLQYYPRQISNLHHYPSSNIGYLE
jgi:hypothetical protein